MTICHCSWNYLMALSHYLIWACPNTRNKWKLVKSCSLSATPHLAWTCQTPYLKLTVLVWRSVHIKDLCWIWPSTPPPQCRSWEQRRPCSEPWRHAETRPSTGWSTTPPWWARPQPRTRARWVGVESFIQTGAVLDGHMVTCQDCVLDTAA